MRRGLIGFLLWTAVACWAAAPQPPNIIIILADDLGWGDLGCYGAKTIATPRIDQMAREGARFTDFYSAAPFCSPSRAALLTGRYPARCGVPYVLFPTEHHGLPPDELTLAEHLKRAGYSTACIGKWHLGWDKPFRPTRNGFDLFFGLPYSNDAIEWQHGEQFAQTSGLGPLPLIRGEKVVEAPVEQSTLTRRYTGAAVEFMRRNRARPFFLYLPHTMPHIPQHSSPEFTGKSAAGVYGGAVEEIDWSVGRILETVRELGLDKDTLVLFTSDNGAVTRPPGWKTERGAFPGRNFGGSNGPLRGSKGQTFEGGMRVPAIFWGPEFVKRGQVISEPASLLDIFPTCAALANAVLPGDRIFDGRNLGPLLWKGISEDARPFYYYFGPQVQAVREGPWKLFLQLTNYPPATSVQSLWYVHQPALFEKHHRQWPAPTLYDLNKDPGETTDVSLEHPEVVERLCKLAQAFDQKMEPAKQTLYEVNGPPPPRPGQIK